MGKSKKQRRAISARRESVQDSQRYASNQQRWEILERDGYKCRYCEVELNNNTANMDHVMPWMKGGQTVVANLVACCQPCNKAKGNKQKGWLPVGWIVPAKPKKKKRNKNKAPVNTVGIKTGAQWKALLDLRRNARLMGVEY